MELGFRGWFDLHLISTRHIPTHKPGLYRVTLYSENEFGTGQITKSGIINTGVVPETDFAAENRQGDPPLTVRFRDFSAGNPTAWSWDFGDGSTSAEKNPSHTYTKEGRYTTTLRVANDIWQRLIDT